MPSCHCSLPRFTHAARAPRERPSLSSFPKLARCNSKQLPRALRNRANHRLFSWLSSSGLGLRTRLSSPSGTIDPVWQIQLKHDGKPTVSMWLIRHFGHYLTVLQESDETIPGRSRSSLAVARCNGLLRGTWKERLRRFKMPCVSCSASSIIVGLPRHPENVVSLGI